MNWLTKNFGLKFVSLVLAIGFWFYVVGEESIEIKKTVPLDIQIPNEKMSVVESSSRTLDITFQAPRHLLSVISSDETAARHVIENVDRAGDYSFSVSTRDIILPSPEVRVTKIFPSIVTVTLDEAIVKKLPIRVDLVGEPAYGYRVDQESIELNPNAVLVEGPRAILENMDAILTEPVQLVGRIRSFQRKVRVQELPEIKPIGEGVTDAFIPVKAEFAEKELTEVVVNPLGIPSDQHYVRINSDHIAITLKGPLAILKDITRDHILAYIDVNGLKGGNHEVPVQFVLPPELSVKDSPPLVLIEVNKLKI
jgi:YbbR domain-containing protein